MSKINLIAIVIVLIIIFCVIQSKYSGFNRLDFNTDSLKLLQSELYTIVKENPIHSINCQYYSNSDEIFMIAIDTLVSYRFLITNDGCRNVPDNIKLDSHAVHTILRMCKWLYSNVEFNYLRITDYSSLYWRYTDSTDYLKKYPRINKTPSLDEMFYIAHFESLVAEVYQFNIAKEFVNKYKEELRHMNTYDEGDSLFMYHQRW